MRIPDVKGHEWPLGSGTMIEEIRLIGTMQSLISREFLDSKCTSQSRRCACLFEITLSAKGCSRRLVAIAAVSLRICHVAVGTQ